jgi:alpha-L-rhamnosidase
VSSLSPTFLRCEYRVNPMGIDVVKPRFSWILESVQRGQAQSAYQIIVASSEENLKASKGDLWDSGKVESDQSAHVVYGGSELESRQRAYWKVKVWDKANKSSESDYARFEMGLLKFADWKGDWISINQARNNDGGTPVHFRKPFQLSKKIKSARLYGSALGVYVASINDKRVGNDIFTPGWTDYTKRVQYQAYDVTDVLRDGPNAIGFVLADGWYAGYLGWGNYHNLYGSQPRGLLQLELEYADGSRETIASDDTWKGKSGPITSADLYNGEVYDARNEMAGWCAPGFDDAAWRAADATPLKRDLPLVAQSGPTVQKLIELPAKDVRDAGKETWIFDMGQNMVGWARLKVKGDAGKRIQLRFVEMLNPDGTAYVTNLRGAKCTDVYITKGGPEEVWEPTFTFHGFRYVEVTGYPGRPPLDAITGVVTYSNTPDTGTFECSNPMVNQLHKNITWGQRGNFLEVPTDCPQRDERLGWMGDAQIFIRTAAYNMDVSSFFTKWLVDVEDAQGAAGDFPDVAPRVVATAPGAPAWGDAGVICPYWTWQMYGDTRVIEKHYAAMTKWMNYLFEGNRNYVRRERNGWNFGDWLSIKADTPKDILATAFWALDAKMMSQMAAAIGRNDDAKTFDELFKKIAGAFNEAFVKEDGRIEGNTQTCYVLALRFGLLPANKRPLALKYLVEDIEGRGGNLSTGFLGVGHITPTLAENGRLDIAYKLLNNDTFPSWGYSIKHGATTIWERWDGWTAEKGFQDPGMNSFNHYALGSVGEWLYHTVAGIGLDESNPGFKHIVLKPQPGGGLSYAKASYQSIHGKIVSDWKLDGAKLSWNITVPANTTATVYVPAKDKKTVMEGGAAAEKAEGVKFVKMEDGAAVYEVASGSYKFTV